MNSKLKRDDLNSLGGTMKKKTSKKQQTIRRNDVEGPRSELARRGLNDLPSPFAFMRRFGEDMDRLFHDFGIGRGILAPTFDGGLDKLEALASSNWAPEIEVFERDNKLVVRADLPGMTQKDLDVEIGDRAL